MIIDQQGDTPTNQIVSGSNFVSTYAANAAAFLLLDLYVEIKRFTLALARKVRFTVDR